MRMRKLQVGAMLSAAVVLSACGSNQYLAIETFDQIPVYSQEQAETVLASIARNSEPNHRFGLDRGELCEVNAVANTLGRIDREISGVGHLPYNQWEANFTQSLDDPVSRFLLTSYGGGGSFSDNCWITIERPAYDSINALLGAANALGISVESLFPRGVALTANDLREGRSGSSDSGIGIGRAIAGIATGAGIAAAVTEGVPPEDAVELGMRVLGAIEGESPSAQSVGSSSDAAVSSLPSSTGASPAQSGANGPCEIPGFYDEGSSFDPETFRVSYCPLRAFSIGVAHSLQAEAMRCRLNASDVPTLPPQRVAEFQRNLRTTCERLAVLAADSGISNCRCPSNYGR